MNTAFNHGRRRPMPVLIAELADLRAEPVALVSVGGKRLDTLREDWFDNAKATADRARANIADVYDIALTGGEPFAVWR